MGSDPELMLLDGNNKLRSAIPVIPEGKGKGRPVKNGAVLHDNVLVEFNTTPAATEDEFVNGLRDVLGELSQLISQQSCQLDVRASAVYPADQLEAEEANIFGCDPDYDAWLLAMNEPPNPFLVGGLRSAGGHLHIGKADDAKIAAVLDTIYGKTAVIRALDVFCSLPWALLENDAAARRRRKLYGKAGAHRPKPYGVEYRALSSHWLTSPEHARLVYRLAAFGVELVCEDGVDQVETSEGQGSQRFQELVTRLGGGDEIVRIINEIDVVAAERAYNEVLTTVLPAPLQATFTACRLLQANFQQAWGL